MYFCLINVTKQFLFTHCLRALSRISDLSPVFHQNTPDSSFFDPLRGGLKVLLQHQSDVSLGLSTDGGHPASGFSPNEQKSLFYQLY